MNRRRFLTTAAGFAGALAVAGLPRSIGPSGLMPRPAEAASLDALTKSAQNRGAAIFGSTEIASQSFEALPQWARILKRMKTEAPMLQQCVQNSAQCAERRITPWHQVITSARDEPRMRQLQRVNQFFNRWPYKIDRELYGISEYWASPIEFMRRSGDCEDYSIAKYFALRQLGFKKEELRVVIIFDRIRNLGHAVLAVYEKGDILILDSLSSVILSHRRYKHYKPQYSMNETTRWAHLQV